MYLKEAVDPLAEAASNLVRGRQQLKSNNLDNFEGIH
jgi:hypothetical protein